MKKNLSLAIATIVMMATLMLQGCNNEANPAEERIAAAEERIAEAEERTAEASKRMAEVMESMIPRSITDRGSGATVGWGSLSPEERAEIIAIGKNHPYGGVIRPEPPIKEMTFILYLEDVPSAAPKQSLIEYTYETDGGVGTNRILVQGHFESISSISSIPDVLNNNSCCIFYGGCIKEYECSTPLPLSEKCSPCEQKKPKCKQCQQGVGTGKKTADGIQSNVKSNGKDREIISIW